MKWLLIASTTALSGYAFYMVMRLFRPYPKQLSSYILFCGYLILITGIVKWPETVSIKILMVGGAFMLVVTAIGISEYRALRAFNARQQRDEELEEQLNKVKEDVIEGLIQSTRPLTPKEVKDIKLDMYLTLLILGGLVAGIIALLVSFWHDLPLVALGCFMLFGCVFIIAMIATIIDCKKKIATNTMHVLRGVVTHKEMRLGNHYIKLNDEQELTITKKEYQLTRYGDQLIAESISAKFKHPIKIKRLGNVINAST